MKELTLMYKFICWLLLLLAIFVADDLHAQNFSNPIADLADPHVTYYNNYYYLTGTTGTNITIKKSSTLNGLKFGTSTVVFTPPSGGPCCNFWAPELHRINDTWYVYYTAGNSQDLSSQRTWVIENASSDPVAGTWTNRGQIYHPTENFWAIDGSVFSLGGKDYFVWSGYSDATNTIQRLYISEMSNPWTLTGPRVLLSSPQYAWERNGEVNEGPVVFQKNQKVFLVYSASGCWTDDYALGMLTMKDSDNPLVASSWTKSPEPIFISNPSAAAYGPGHNAFFESPDGTEIWNVYHATTIAAGACDFTRTTRAQKLEWNTDGTPAFGIPVKTGDVFPAPAGEQQQHVLTILENGVYKLVSKASDKVLDLAACSPALGVNVVQNTWAGRECQRWNIQATGDGYFVLTSVRGGLALDVAGCSNDNFTNVHTWAPNGAFCQQWKIEDVGNGYYRLLARNSNKALTVLMNSQEDGADVLQQDFSGADGQQWRIEVPEEVVTATEQEDEISFSVFPNPAKTIITIKVNASHHTIEKIMMVDLLSKEVYAEMRSVGRDAWTLNVADLASGLYLLRIKFGNDEFVKKIIIEK
jgi:GH43 family beta-xylosidase